MVRTGILRGSKSRNKVSVGEPAEGSRSQLISLRKFDLITTNPTVRKRKVFGTI